MGMRGGCGGMLGGCQAARLSPMTSRKLEALSWNNFQKVQNETSTRILHEKPRDGGWRQREKARSEQLEHSEARAARLGASP